MEDNAGDELLTRLALEQAGVVHRLQVAHDGVEALELLHRGDYRPDLVLLDLNLPRKDGRAVLAALKADEALRSIPVTVLTSSSSARDVDACYRTYASGYVVKPETLAQLVDAFRALDRYWFVSVQLPSRPPDAGPV